MCVAGAEANHEGHKGAQRESRAQARNYTFGLLRALCGERFFPRLPRVLGGRCAELVEGEAGSVPNDSFYRPYVPVSVAVARAWPFRYATIAEAFALFSNGKRPAAKA